MFLKIIIFLIGIILTILGITSIILYLNLIPMGYTFLEYVNFIIRRFECISLIIGLIIIYLLIFKGGNKWNIYMI